MSSELQEFHADAKGLRFAIVTARFNRSITEKLTEGAREALSKAGAAGVDEFVVPGAFELPLAALRLASSEAYDGIIALGAVIRGDTPHFDYVAGQAANGLQLVALETGVPVAFGVLTTDNKKQAQARAGGKHGNKGHDAAMTAIEMANFGRPAAKPEPEPEEPEVNEASAKAPRSSSKPTSKTTSKASSKNTSKTEAKKK